MSNFYSTNQGIADVSGQGAADTVVPQVLLPSRTGKALNCKHKMVSIASSNGAQSGPSGMLLFNLPAQGYFKPGSGYIKFQFRPETTPLPGPAVGNANGEFARGFSAGAGSLFNRVSLSVGAGQQIEVINNYNVYQDLLLSHCSTNDYVLRDAKITESCQLTFDHNITQFLCVPLASSVLQNAKAFPLWLTPGGITIQVDLETVQRSVKNGVNYTITNAIFCYEVLTPDESFLMTMKNEMVANNKLYEIPLVSVQSLQTNRNSESLNFLTGVNLSSVNSVFWAEVKVADENALDTSKLVVHPCPLILNSTSYDRELLIDGEKRISYALQSDAQVFMELQRCISGITDAQVTSIVNNTTYPSSSYWNGINLQRFPYRDTCMRGSPVGNMQLNVNFINGNPAVTNVFIYIVYDSVLVISPSTGSVAVAK